MAGPRLPLVEFLAQRRTAHDALTDAPARAVVRYKVRKRCKAEGAAIPEWAAEALRAAEPAPTPEPARVTHEPATATPFAVPEALRAWRARGVSRVVQFKGPAVILHAYGERPRKFANVAAAINAAARE